MKKSPMLGATNTLSRLFASILLLCTWSSVNAVVLDFESVADGGEPCFGGTCAIVGNPYVEDGFVVNSANTAFASWDSTNVNNPGSKTLNAGNDGETIELFVEPVTGPIRFFTLHSIDLSELFSTGGTVPVTFTGFKMDSSTVTATFNLDGVFGFETFTFTGWDNLLGVTWVQTADYHQFDNIVVSVSAVPIPAAVWLFGSGLLGLIGMARRKKS